MSFLDQLKSKKQGEGAAAATPAGAPKPNPLGGKPNPLTAKNPLTAAPAAEVPAGEKKAIPFLQKKDAPNPFLQKKESAEQPAAEEPTAPEQPAAEPATPVEEAGASPAQEDAAPEAEEKQEAPDAAQEAPEAPASVIEDIKEADGSAPAPVTEQPAASKPEDKPTRRRGGKKDKPETPAASATASQGDDMVDVPRTRISYAEALEAVSSGFVDPEWEEFRAHIEEELANIEIKDDMHPGTLKLAIGELSKLRQEIWSPFQDIKTTFEHLSLKEPEGLIERIKKISLGDGTNDLQRKKAGVEACMNFVDPRSGAQVNLYELLDETRMRYNFLKATMDSIQYKTQILITMSGALKLEKDHLVAAEG